MKPVVKSVGVEVSIGGSVQIIKYEYTENYIVSREQSWSGEWTEEEADAFYDEKYDEIYAKVNVKAEAEVTRLETMRDKINSLED